MTTNWIEQGGLILKILIGFNIFGWAIMLWKGFSIILFNKRIKKEEMHFHDYFKSYDKGFVKINESEKLNIALSHYIDPLYKGMNTIKVIASISPLLGLLGTVWGILNSFSVIAEKGLDNPTLFASGISMALITTVGGLIVAIPHFIGHNYLSSTLINLEKKLEKQILC